MIRLIIIFCLSVCLISSKSDTFKDTQKRFERVEAAYNEKWKSIKNSLHEHGVDTNNIKLFIRGFKIDKALEVWAALPDGKYTLVKNYPMCKTSGEPGPKRREGDGQIPEGFYTIDLFNPQSSFHLSMRVSYPNKSDKILGVKDNLGGAIMIHGSCVTIGCIPITDEYIKELYVLAVESKSKGHNIPVHIFPTRLDSAGFARLGALYPDNQELQDFWKNLEPGYNSFQEKNRLPVIQVENNGRYVYD